MTSIGEFVYYPVSPRPASTALHCVLPRPLPGTLVVFGHVSLVQPGNLRDQRVVGVGVAQQRAYRQQHL